MQNLILKSLHNGFKSLSLSACKPTFRSVIQLTKCYTSTSVNSVDGLNHPSILIKLYSTEKKSDETASKLEEIEKKIVEISKQRAKNPYTIFLKEKFKTLAKENPNAKSREIIKLAGNVWSAMSFDEKFTYMDTASENRKKTEADLNELYSKLDKNEARLIKKNLTKKRIERRSLLSEYRIRREKNLLKRPKKPASAFILYSKSLDRGEAGIKDFIIGASLKWKALAQQDKEVYLNEAKGAQRAYKDKLREWETQMIVKGKDYLVRKSFKQVLEKNLKKDKLANKEEKLKKKSQKALKKNLRNLRNNIKSLKKFQVKASAQKKSAKARERGRVTVPNPRQKEINK